MGWSEDFTTTDYLVSVPSESQINAVTQPICKQRTTSLYFLCSVNAAVAQPAFLCTASRNPSDLPREREQMDGSAEIILTVSKRQGL